MKTLAELQAIRDRMKDNVVMRSGVNNLHLNEKVTVTQTGCIGICRYEPIVEVFEADKEKVTYVNMTAEKVRRVAKEHLRDGKVVEEYTIGAVEK